MSCNVDSYSLHKLHHACRLNGALKGISKRRQRFQRRRRRFALYCPASITKLCCCILLSCFSTLVNTSWCMATQQTAKHHGQGIRLTVLDPIRIRGGAWWFDDDDDDYDYALPRPIPTNATAAYTRNYRRSLRLKMQSLASLVVHLPSQLRARAANDKAASFRTTSSIHSPSNRGGAMVAVAPPTQDPVVSIQRRSWLWPFYSTAKETPLEPQNSTFWESSFMRDKASDAPAMASAQETDAEDLVEETDRAILSNRYDTVTDDTVVTTKTVHQAAHHQEKRLRKKIERDRLRAEELERVKNAERVQIEAEQAAEGEIEADDANIKVHGDILLEDESMADAESVPSADLTAEIAHFDPAVDEEDSLFTSSGYWDGIDRALTFGVARSHPKLRLSRKLRRIRKLSARMTGMHGMLSGKPYSRENTDSSVTSAESDDESTERMGVVRRRIAAITKARENLARFVGVDVLDDKDAKRSGLDDSRDDIALEINLEAEKVDRLRNERVKEIDLLIMKNQKLLQDLACEKDVLQQRHNPLWNYTVNEESINVFLERESVDSAGLLDEVNPLTSREFSFPPKDLVDEYLDLIFANGRIIKMNHTDLWRNGEAYADDDDDDELSSPREDARRRTSSSSSSGSSGTWLLRNGLGEKIGEAVETAGYKAICQSMMSVLARILSTLHGQNIMRHADISLSMDSAPDLPPLAAGSIPSSGKNSNYAQNAIERAMKKGVRRRKSAQRDGDFIQRDAVVETLLSHCQISAPLLTLFPIAWQRALLGNIITLVAAVIADFCEGLEFQILGHRLSIAFNPITESDMLRQIGMMGAGFNRKRVNQERFEEAVQATADDLADTLKFLDRWHERALGSGLLRQQIANLIARVVLTLADDVLSGARIDLWAAQGGGPRLVAGLEYRQ